MIMTMGVLFGAILTILMLSFVVAYVALSSRRDMIKDGTWQAYKDSGGW